MLSQKNFRYNLIRESLETRSFLKIISGINNFDKEKVLTVARAVKAANATAIDISAREDIIIAVREILKDTALVVSSVKVEELKRAQELGADILELGNFEALYEEGVYLSAAEVLSLAKELSEIKIEGTVLSVTVPGHLNINEQVKLAADLENLGVEIIQTEGSLPTDANSSNTLGVLQKVMLTLSNTIELSKNLKKTFILTASGISPDTAALAITAGAHGIGVGKYINRLESELEMLASIRRLQESLSITQIERTLQEQELILN
jgi:hypothetical protein